jgi:hypothetical protein
MTNPLQKYFRQPKIFVSLPSRGMYWPSGTFVGDSSNVPVMGMTGMDEILAKTPDALLNGEATVKIIESCCPYIKDAWAVPSLDLDLLLVSIRIATYGSSMTLDHTCSKCEHENSYETDLTNVVNHLNSAQFDNTLVIDPIKINLKPLTYRQMTEFNLRNFSIRRQIFQAMELTDQDEQQKVIDAAYTEMAGIKADSIIARIETVETIESVVDDVAHIAEWIQNSDRELFSKITEFFDKSQAAWEIPKMPTTCVNCGNQTDLELTMDQASFFGQV